MDNNETEPWDVKSLGEKQSYYRSSYNRRSTKTIHREFHKRSTKSVDEKTSDPRVSNMAGKKSYSRDSTKFLPKRSDDQQSNKVIETQFEDYLSPKQMDEEESDEQIARMAKRSQYMKRMSTKSGESNEKRFERASKVSSIFGKRRISTSIENITKAIELKVLKMSESDKAVEDSKSIVTEQVLEEPSEREVEIKKSDESSKGEEKENLSESDSVERTISELNFRISDTELTQLMSRTTIKRKAKTIIHSKRDYMPISEFERVVKKLYKCCLKSVTDLHELHVRRLLALPIISDILARADPEYISTAHIVHMVWSVMSCLHHFQLRLKSGSSNLIMSTRQKMVDKCMEYYLQLIRMFKPKMHKIILSAIITFYKDGKLWDIEFACTDMIVALLDIYPDVEDGVNELLNSAIYSSSLNTTEAQKLMQVIYEVLRSVKWHKISRKLIDRLIFMLESSISPKEDAEHIIYEPLKLGIDLCIRHVINNISNNDVMVMLKRLLKRMVDEDVTEEIMLSFGNLSSYAAANYEMRFFYASITPDLLMDISSLAHERNPMTFLTAVRIWLNLIDRNKNSCKINQPKIFFRGCDYDLMIKKKCNVRDRQFFKAHRNYFYILITDCFKKCSCKIEMNIIFEMCAVTLVEIPCGYTAATFTSVAMSMQEYGLKISSENLVKSHYMHAVALSILSLICYIHKAEVFYQYVTHIIDRRAEWAPHLIPPLKSKYEYALHHVLWNKPELFFEDWEARYGLWKCFRIRKKRKE